MLFSNITNGNKRIWLTVLAITIIIIGSLGIIVTSLSFKEEQTIKANKKIEIALDYYFDKSVNTDKQIGLSKNLVNYSIQQGERKFATININYDVSEFEKLSDINEMINITLLLFSEFELEFKKDYHEITCELSYNSMISPYNHCTGIEIYDGSDNIERHNIQFRSKINYIPMTIFTALLLTLWVLIVIFVTIIYPTFDNVDSSNNIYN